MDSLWLLEMLVKRTVFTLDVGLTASWLITCAILLVSVWWGSEGEERDCRKKKVVVHVLLNLCRKKTLQRNTFNNIGFLTSSYSILL